MIHLSEDIPRHYSEEILKRNVGIECRATHKEFWENRFYDKYMQGRGIDVGAVGSDNTTVAILPGAQIIDLGTPGYDGITLPLTDESQDYVFSSHMWEHVKERDLILKEWFRVTKIGGYVIIFLPHQFLYEKKKELPSKWNGDHRKFFTPGIAMREIENIIEPNTYRLRFMRDNDDGFDYSRGPTVHSHGRYQIEIVLQKIKKPNWELA
jgi:SAM-dependent methyltransferase